MHWSSRRPPSSKKHNSTRSACSEKSAKLTPSPSHVAPRGSGRPGHTAVMGVIYRLRKLKLHLLSVVPAPDSSIRGRASAGTRRRSPEDTGFPLEPALSMVEGRE